MANLIFLKLRLRAGWLCACVLAAVGCAAEEWTPDTLGGNYVKTTIEMPDDYSGKVVCTLVKHTAEPRRDVAVVYLHGYNDYFFQRALGDSVAARGYGFFAVDLRKYGRSIRSGQKKFEVKNLKEYFADIDSSLAVVKREGFERVAFMAHSTGGLIMSYYLSERKDDCPMVRALILNSPFLDMNLSGFQEKFLVPLVTSLPFKKISIPQGDSRAYAESLLSKYHGEWEYNTEWKLEVSPPVTVGWLTGIRKAQRHVQKKADIRVPVLLLHSDKSVDGKEWTPAFNAGDAVLDVDDISKYGRRLGDRVTEVTVEDGLHDLILSRKDVRDRVYQTVFDWLRDNGL